MADGITRRHFFYGTLLAGAVPAGAVWTGCGAGFSDAE